MENVRGEVEFQDVSFRYEEHLSRVLRHINLKVPAGSYVALVGTSGAGKTTLCSLIPRFYDVSEGRILIDGCDIRHYKLKSLRDHIGIVQRISENITQINDRKEIQNFTIYNICHLNLMFLGIAQFIFQNCIQHFIAGIYNVMTCL